MILSCQNIEKAFLEKQVLKNCSFHIEDYEKAAIVGLMVQARQPCCASSSDSSSQTAA